MKTIHLELALIAVRLVLTGLLLWGVFDLLDVVMPMLFARFGSEVAEPLQRIVMAFLGLLVLGSPQK